MSSPVENIPLHSTKMRRENMRRYFKVRSRKEQSERERDRKKEREKIEV
jgi:hypothetical protein